MRFRRQWTAAAVLLALCLGTKAQAQQAVFDQVPADALVVVKLKNLNQVSRKVAKMAKDLGLDQLSPEMADPIGALEKESHLGKGVNKDGDLALAFLDASMMGGNGDKPPSMIVLVPVSDYKAFVGNFKNPVAEGDVTKASPPEGGDQAVYLAHWGNFAAVSPAKETLAKKPTGLKLQGPALKESDAKDALLYVNMAAVRNIALPQMQQHRADMAKELDNVLGQAGDAGKKFAPTARAAFNQVMTYAERFMVSSRSVTLGLGLSDVGITSTMTADFEPASYFGKIASQVKNTNGPLTNGLPDRKYIVFGGSTNDPKVATPLLADFLDPITKELATVPEGKAVSTLIEAVKRSSGAVTASSFGWVAPEGALGQESVIQQVVVQQGDAATLQASNRQALQSMGELMKLVPQTPQASTSFVVKPAGKNVGGVALDTFESVIKLDDNDPQAAQMKQIFAWIYGPNGNGGVMGAVGPKAFLTVSGGSDQLISDAITSAKANAPAAAAANAGVRAVAGQLPKERVGEFYFEVDTLVVTAVRYARGLGLPVPVKIAADLPPIGAAVAADGSGVRADGFVPMDLIKGLVASGMEAQKAMNQPGGGLSQ